MGKRMLTTGTYINLWTIYNDYDVFITLNEANCNPTPEEIDEIEKNIRPIFESNIKEKQKAAQDVLDEMELNCLVFGGEIIMGRRN